MKKVFFAVMALGFAITISFKVCAQAGSLSEQEITQLVDGDLKAASKIIEQEINKSPEDAALHKLAGDVFAVRAQGASLLSAPGLARKCLKSYKKAVELGPNDSENRMALFQYLAFAPGIVGGSTKKAQEQLSEMEKFDPIAGVVAKSFLLLKEKDYESLENLYEELPKEQRTHARIKIAEAHYLRNREKYNPAFTLLQEVMDTPLEPLTNKQDRLHVFNAMLQAGYLGMKSEAHQEQGIQAFKRYIDEAPDTYRLTSKKWARLFLGNAYANAGDTEAAKTTLLQAKNLASDEGLLKEINKALKKL